MELADITKPLENRVKPIPFDKFQKSGDWMVPRGLVYYTPMGNFVKGVILCMIDISDTGIVNSRLADTSLLRIPR